MMTTPTTTLPSASEIIRKMTAVLWEKLKYTGEAPTPTAHELFSNSELWEIPSEQPIGDLWGVLMDQKEPREPDWSEHVRATATPQSICRDPEHEQITPEFCEKTIVDLEKAWQFARKEEKKLVHPLAPALTAWLQETNTTKVTKEYDSKHPAAILKSPMGSIREISFEDTDFASLKEFATPERVEQIKQLTFDLKQERNALIPPVMPLEIAHPMGIQPNTKRGAVSHTIRVFFEAIMALKPHQRQADICFTLGDLISYLYPDGKFNRTNQLEYVTQAVEILHYYATVPFFDDGKIRRWRPVAVRSVPDSDMTNDTRIYLDVKLPPDAKQGYMIIKDIHRRLGKESAPKFNAYHVACYLWDKYGTHRGKLADPTRPREARNESGQLIHPTTSEPILTPRGKPITNVFDTNAVRQLPREANPDAIKQYPILSDEALILACKPNGYDPKRRNQEAERAKVYWSALEQEGIIAIEKEKDGWRILPPERHLQTYRGVKEGSKKSSD